MKAKLIRVILPVLLLLTGCTRPAFVPPVQVQQVQTATVYYFNSQTKKQLDAPQDIASLVDALAAARDAGTYGEIPTGGQSFSLLFTLSDGSTVPCIYYQTAAGSGCWVDPNSNTRLTDLDMTALWQTLSAPEQPGSAQEEYTGWPQL